MMQHTLEFSTPDSSSNTAIVAPLFITTPCLSYSFYLAFVLCAKLAFFILGLSLQTSYNYWRIHWKSCCFEAGNLPPKHRQQTVFGRQSRPWYLYTAFLTLQITSILQIASCRSDQLTLLRTQAFRASGHRLLIISPKAAADVARLPASSGPVTANLSTLAAGPLLIVIV